MGNAPQQPTTYRTKLRRHNELSVRATVGITDAERAELDALKAELEAAELEHAQAQAGSLGGARP